MSNIVRDKNILWLEVPKRGNPQIWESGKEYKKGDTVIPSPNTQIPAGKEGVMFQCVGFCGKTSSIEPTWDTVVGNKIIDGEVEYTVRDIEQPSLSISNNEYYCIEHELTVV